MKAGIFLASALALLLFICLYLGNVIGALTEQRVNYVVRFSLADGALGLKKGSTVKIGGQEVGQVTAVGFLRPVSAVDPPPDEIVAVPGSVVPVTSAETVAAPAGMAAAPAAPAGGTPAAPGPAPDAAASDAPPSGVFVTISIRKDTPLYRDAKVYLELPLLGSVSSLNIPDVGGNSFTTQTKDPVTVVTRQFGRLQQWEVVTGTLAPPAFLGQAGYGADQKEQLQIILQRGKEISEQVNDMVRSSKAGLDGTLASLRQAVDNINDATGSVNKDLPNWLVLIGESLKNVNIATGEMKDRLIEAKALVSTVLSIIDDNRQYVNQIFQNSAKATGSVAELTDKVNTELYVTVKETMADARRALSAFADVGEKASQFATEKTPELGRIIANARLASDQMKLTMTEVRRNPWRLLYQPTRREIEEELTYDSARTYAEAVGQLRAASDSLQAVLAQGSAASGRGSEPTAEQRRRIDEITGEINAAFARYREAERKFLDRLIRDGK